MSQALQRARNGHLAVADRHVVSCKDSNDTVGARFSASSTRRAGRTTPARHGVPTRSSMAPLHILATRSEDPHALELSPGGDFAAALTVGLRPSSAHARACGGCFSAAPADREPDGRHRPPDDPQRSSQEQSTLYDQIKYSGNPSSFAWVLPISGTVDVGLSADIVFQALDGMTQTQDLAAAAELPAAADDCGFGAAFERVAPRARRRRRQRRHRRRSRGRRPVRDRAAQGDRPRARSRTGSRRTASTSPPTCSRSSMRT